MAVDARYHGQVSLLVRLLPIVAEEPCFGLKGGTAINLFYRDLPRLSVDIDLVYLPVEERTKSFKSIDEALNRIAASIEARIIGARCTRTAGGDNQQTRITVREGTSNVKIEVSPVMRGSVLEPSLRAVTEAVEDEFGFAEMNVLAFEEVYAGKLVAALDRQHPRDLFDVLLLHGAEGVTETLFQIFLIYVACSSRPMHELLDPNLRPLEQVYEQEFAGMPERPVELAELDAAREWLISEVKKRLKGDAADFLKSLHEGEPDFALLGIPEAGSLPAIRWKVQNLRKFKKEYPDRHQEAGEKLYALLGEE